MRGIPTPSTHCSCAEPAPIFPYRPRPKTKKRSPNLQRKRHIRELGSSIARLSFLHPIAPVIMAVAPFMSLIAAATLVDSGARAQTPAHPPSIYRFANFIAEASARFTVPARWFRAIIQIESAGDERAISSRGAMGLMQLMPATWVEPLRVFGSLQLGNWALGTSDRGGQDKSRKVRTVGSVRNSFKYRLTANIANVACNLLFSTTRHERSSFGTLRRD